MKRIMFLVLTVILLVGLALPCFAEELSDPEAETLIEKGKAVIEEWGVIIMEFIDVIKEYTPQDWQVVIEEQVVPWVTLAISSILSVYIAISPVLFKIKKTSDRFNNSSDKLEESQKVAEKAKNQLKQAQEDLQKLEVEFEEVKEGYKQMISSISNIEQIVRIGFGNSDELIVKGYAHEIAKVGNDNDKKENKAA